MSGDFDLDKAVSDIWDDSVEMKDAPSSPGFTDDELSRLPDWVVAAVTELPGRIAMDEARAIKEVDDILLAVWKKRADLGGDFSWESLEYVLRKSREWSATEVAHIAAKIKYFNGAVGQEKGAVVVQEKAAEKPAVVQEEPVQEPVQEKPAEKPKSKENIDQPAWVKAAIGSVCKKVTTDPGSGINGIKDLFHTLERYPKEMPSGSARYWDELWSSVVSGANWNEAEQALIEKKIHESKVKYVPDFEIAKSKAKPQAVEKPQEPKPKEKPKAVEKPKAPTAKPKEPVKAPQGHPAAAPSLKNNPPAFQPDPIIVDEESEEEGAPEPPNLDLVHNLTPQQQEAFRKLRLAASRKEFDVPAEFILKMMLAVILLSILSCAFS